MRRALAALLGAAVLLAPHVAHADAEAARFHDARARRHYNAGRYENAIAEFFLAQRNAPNVGTILNIAVCFQLLHRWDEAFLHYTEFLERAEPGDERRGRAEEALAEIGPHVARVRVVTEPEGATLYVDTRERGSYGLAPRLLAVPAGARTIEAALDGYRAARAEVRAVVGREATVTLRLEPITGALALRANVDATVEVRSADGELVAQGSTPFEAALPPGPYVAEVAALGYVSRRELVAIDADARVERDVTLSETPVPTGELTVTSSLTGAVVAIDGRPAGFTPLALTDVPEGLRAVEVSGDGLEPWRGDVRVAGEDRAWLTVSLQPEQTATHSDLTWILGGAGLVLLAAGAVLGGLAIDNWERFNAGLGHDNVRDLYDRGPILEGAADTSLTLGGATLLVAGILFVVEELSGRPRTSGTVTRRPR
ncbi:MAG: PEGA domain-containing protein [Sandaracinaceae bacterium]